MLGRPLLLVTWYLLLLPIGLSARRLRACSRSRRHAYALCVCKQTAYRLVYTRIAKIPKRLIWFDHQDSKYVLPSSLRTLRPPQWNVLCGKTTSFDFAFTAESAKAAEVKKSSFNDRTACQPLRDLRDLL